MLLAVQWPLCDVRSLIVGPTARLEVPPWPMAEPGRDFVRGFGAVQRRRRGGVDAWVGEERYCEARRALRFPHQLRPGPPAGDAKRVATRCVFRRLLCDGSPGVRVELGVRVKAIGRPKTALSPTHAAALIRWLASQPVEIPSGGPVPYAGPLIAGGPALADAYLRATSDRRTELPLKPQWVCDEEPVIFVEYRPGELGELPPGVLALPTIAERFRIELGHARFTAHGRSFRTWLLGVGPKTDRDALRRLRIHLLRLHAERGALRGVLRAIASHQLEIAPGSEATDRLERFLQEGCRRLGRPRAFGLPQEDILPLAQGYEDLIDPGHRATLLAHLQKVRFSVRTAVREAARRAATKPTVVYNLQTEELTMNQFTIKLGDNNVLHGDLVVAQRIQESFNRTTESDVNADLKRELQDLSRVVAEMTQKLEQQAARQAARDLDTLTAEALSPSPRKPWYELAATGLIDAAHRAGEASGVVTKIVRSVLALLGG